MRTLILSGMMALLIGIACAQTGGNYDLSWWTIDGGGVTFASSADYTLGATIGQPDASGVVVGLDYTLTGGFWFCLSATNGDADGSGCTDDADQLLVLFNFGASGPNAADVNCDGTVDDADLLLVLFNFGSGC